MRIRLSLVVLLLSVCFTTAQAQVRPWISAGAGFNTYAMDDVNDEIGAVNSLLAGSGLEMDEINSSFGFGGALGFDLPNGFVIGLAYDRLSARTEVGDASGSLEYSLPGNLFRGFGRYRFTGGGKASGFLEASIGRISTSGEAEIIVVDSGTATAQIEGSGLAFEGSLGGEYWSSPRFALTGSLGFRHAESKDVEVDGQPAYDISGGDYTIDYSGIFVRAGLKLMLGS